MDAQPVRCNSLKSITIKIYSAIRGGAAARMGEEEKDLCYSEEVDSAGSTFFPLLVESYGYWSDDTLRSLKLIASKTASRCTVLPFNLHGLR